MRIRYSHTYWGSDHLNPADFVKAIAEAGYEGMELFLIPGDEISRAFMKALDEIRKQIPDFYLVLLQLHFPDNGSVEDYLIGAKRNLEELAALQPDFINSHTGADFFSFDDNCRSIDILSNASVKTGVKVYHETHRGRFSFHAPTLLPYLEKFPEMELVGDLSHFCTVSESMLHGQEEILKTIFPRIAHVHARIGFEQGPQVNNPAAPEWASHEEKFLGWWKEIAHTRKQLGKKSLSFTTEFGPAPYLPLEPFSQKPLSNQWKNNLWMLEKLKSAFGQSLD
jgi:sugar phosphate isomerase/epimerase